MLDLHNKSEESVFGGLVRQLLGQENFNKSYFSAFMLETESLKMGRLLYPEATFLNRLLVNKIYFDSPAQSRAPFSGKCNSFVRYKRKNVEYFGQILYFIILPNAASDRTIFASVAEFDVVQEVGPVTGFFYLIRKTEREDLINVDSLSKVFCVSIAGECFAMKLCNAFDHS